MSKKQNIVRKTELETKADKLERIKSSVDTGTYTVDSKEVAKAIIKDTKDKANKK